MKYSAAFFCSLLIAIYAIAPAVSASDYVRLKSGRVIECAILRQDTSILYTTDWNRRAELQPPLQVYEREEVESIWFAEPPREVRQPYVPHPSGMEAGGSLAFQTWASSQMERRHALLMSLHGGYTILPQLSLEVEGCLTVPMSGSADTSWQKLDAGYQLAMNVVAHPFIWKGIVPFLAAGGGLALDVPVGNTILTGTKQARNLLDIGVGLKWGSGGVGYRIEWRHYLYEWTPDGYDELDRRLPSESADASVIRAMIFIYR
ncbi:hypothetical protein EHM69_11205 [candidate division KSB1 bacterium]|nr:MAG: hypothetical protein EHM69_11205 [candidate division KSB1 bacterium]